MNEKVDVKENYILEIDEETLSILLQDRSSRRNIIWATDNYAHRGANYYSYMPITIAAITGRNGKVIKPRVGKSKKEQTYRIRDKAEVFTPSWICNCQNNLIDDSWFGYKGAFNTENDKTWQTNSASIKFPEGKTWQDYVTSNRLEITCGEAPYLCSRYDTVTGEWIEPENRIGILDRKIRIVNENTSTGEEWFNWVKRAYMATYGFEWQGDSLLIARENLLFAFMDYYSLRFNNKPSTDKLQEIAKIISWNIWQMDGLKFVIPNSCKPVPKMQISMFDSAEESEPCPGCLKNNPYNHTGIYCKIMDWEKKRPVRVVDLLKGE